MREKYDEKYKPGCHNAAPFLTRLAGRMEENAIF